MSTSKITSRLLLAAIALFTFFFSGVTQAQTPQVLLTQTGGVSTPLTTDGGQLISFDKNIVIDFMPQAAMQYMTASLNLNVLQTIPSRFVLIGRVFEVSGTPNTQSVATPKATGSKTTYTPPAFVPLITVTIQYSLTAAVSEKEMVLAALSETGKWLPLPTQVDYENDIVTAQSDRLTQFALVVCQSKCFG